MATLFLYKKIKNGNNKCKYINMKGKCYEKVYNFAFIIFNYISAKCIGIVKKRFKRNRGKKYTITIKQVGI